MDLEQLHQNIIYEQTNQPKQLQFAQTLDDIYLTGTFCKASFQKFMENGQQEIYLILKGLQRIQLLKQLNKEDYVFIAKTQPIRDHATQFTNDANYKVKLGQLLQIYARLRQRIPINVPELLHSPAHPSTIDVLCGFLCLTTFFSREEILKLFFTLPIHERLSQCVQYYEQYENQLTEQWQQIEQKSTLPASPQMEKKQMKDIYQFLQKQFASPKSAPFVQNIEEMIKNRNFPNRILGLLKDELSQISELSESHPDYNLKRNFIELLTSLPFGIFTEDIYSLKRAEQVFQETHFGMEEVKQRILEFLSVSKLKGKPTGKALLLVGPPGVGKTSIASTIAKCLNRKFVRISLGGENDVAIIKGHRRTYMASYPGKLVQALKQAQSENPVILLDEIDKLNRSYRGSIADALLELLDPVQNGNFIDNYLEVPIDLSKVLFIASANLSDTIPGPLMDRMEVIQLSGYTMEEKLQISKKHLIPSILEECGLKPYYQEEIKDDLLEYIINGYCRESGVRSLRRTLKQLFEKLVIRVVKHQQNKESNDKLDLCLNKDCLEDLIGLPQFDSAKRKNVPGLGVGLAYNQYGGSLMYIEIVKQKHYQKEDMKVGGLRITGQLGQTIKESVEIAYTHAKKVLKQKYDNDFLEQNELHIHFPAGGVKKDGPSGGIAIASGLVSIGLNKSIKDDIAMTGEISLTGKVLRIGGLKEKVLAAKREGIKQVIIPKGNEQDLNELPERLKEGIQFHLVDEFDQVVELVY